MSPAPARAARRPPIHAVAGLAFCALGFAVRLHRLGAESLWYDETVSAHLAALPPAEAVARTSLDIHPPGYYLALGLWADVAGLSEFSLAFLSCFFGVILIALTCTLARRAGGEGAAVVAAGASALSAYGVWYSQEVRMYTMAAALACLLVWVTMQAADELRPGRWWLAWGATAAAALYTLYYSLFLLPAVSLYWLFRSLQRRHQNRRALAHWLSGHLWFLLLYLPWLSIALRQALDPPVPAWRSPVSWIEALRQGASALALGESAPPWWWPLAALLTAVAFLAPFMGATRKAEATLLVAAYSTPWLGIMAISAVQPLFHPRYLFPYSPFFIACLALTIAGAISRRTLRPVGLALALAFVSANVVSLDRFWSLPEFRADDLRGAADTLADQWVPGDVILVNAGYTYTALAHYWPGEIAWIGRVTDYSGAVSASGPVILIGGSLDADPRLGWGHPDSDFYATTLTESVAGLERALAVNRRLWVFRLYDTVTDPSGALRAWLADSLVQTADISIAGPSFGRLQAFVPPLEQLPCAKPLTWGGQVLTCVEVGTPVVERIAPVYIYARRATTPIRQPEPVHYTLRLQDPSGSTVAQVDGALVLDASGWPETVAILNPVSLKLPSQAPAGDYTVVLGLYSLPEAGLQTLGPSLAGQPLDAPDGLIDVGKVSFVH